MVCLFFLPKIMYVLFLMAFKHFLKGQAFIKMFNFNNEKKKKK